MRISTIMLGLGAINLFTVSVDLLCGLPTTPISVGLRLAVVLSCSVIGLHYRRTLDS